MHGRTGAHGEARVCRASSSVQTERRRIQEHGGEAQEPQEQLQKRCLVQAGLRSTHAPSHGHPLHL